MSKSTWSNKNSWAESILMCLVDSWLLDGGSKHDSILFGLSQFNQKSKQPIILTGWRRHKFQCHYFFRLNHALYSIWKYAWPANFFCIQNVLRQLRLLQLNKWACKIWALNCFHTIFIQSKEFCNAMEDLTKMYQRTETRLQFSTLSVHIQHAV